LIITSRIKPEISGHIVQSFSRKCMNVHHIHRLLYEQEEVLYENNCLSTGKKMQVKDLKV